MTHTEVRCFAQGHRASNAGTGIESQTVWPSSQRMLAGDEKVEKATAGEGSSMQRIFCALCLAFCVGGLDTEMQGAVGEVHGLLVKMEGDTDVSASHVIIWWAIPSCLLGFVG